MREVLNTRSLGVRQLLIFYWTSTHIKQPFWGIDQERSVQGLLQDRKQIGCNGGKILGGEGKCHMSILQFPQMSHKQQTITREQVLCSILCSLWWHHMSNNQCRICHLCSSYSTWCGILMWACGYNILRCRCHSFIWAGGTPRISVWQVEAASMRPIRR
jgi:hypothetical protein